MAVQQLCDLSKYHLSGHLYRKPRLLHRRCNHHDLGRLGFKTNRCQDLSKESYVIGLMQGNASDRSRTAVPLGMVSVSIRPNEMAATFMLRSATSAVTRCLSFRDPIQTRTSGLPSNAPAMYDRGHTSPEVEMLACNGTRWMMSFSRRASSVLIPFICTAEWSPRSELLRMSMVPRTQASGIEHTA